MAHHPDRSPRSLWLRRPVAAALLMVLGVAGCKGWRVEPMPAARVIREQQPEVVRVERASDSTRLVLYSPSIMGDSLRGLPTELAIRSVTVPLGDVRTLSTRRFSLGKTMLMVLAAGGGVALYQLLQSLNQVRF
jgi:hypothetical protein